MTNNVYIYCEGQSEESFVNELLYPYLLGMNIFAMPIIASTKRTANKKYRGGIVGYEKSKSELLRICKGHKHELVTTLIDYYALPAETPGMKLAAGCGEMHVRDIEAAVNEDIGEPNLRFHLQLHEFEALLFSEPQAFGAITESEEVLAKIRRVRDAFPTPEDINNSPATAPSKRILRLIPGYKKVLDGSSVARAAGIDVMLRECPHFDGWVNEIVHYFA